MSIKLSKLGEQATIIMGQSPPGESYNKNGNGIPLLNGPTEFGPLHPIEKQWTTSPKKFCQPGDILFCVRGATAGRLNLADKEYCLGRGLAAIRGKSGKFDSVFLRYVLSNGYASFQARGVGSTFINISREELAAFEVPVLPLMEQRRIADILGRAEALRAKRRATLAQLNELTEAIFIDMFGDPVSNPKEWQTIECANICERITVGIVVKPASYYVSSGVPALRSLNIKPGYISLEDLVYFSENDNNTKLAKTKLKTGDLVIIRTGQPGTSAVVPADLEGVNAIDLLIATPKPNIVNPVFFSQFFNSSGGRSIVLTAQRGQIQKHLNVGSLSESCIPLPPIELQQEFARRVEAIEKLKATHKASLAEIDDLFASLQCRAFRGEL